MSDMVEDIDEENNNPFPEGFSQMNLPYQADRSKNSTTNNANDSELNSDSSNLALNPDQSQSDSTTDENDSRQDLVTQFHKNHKKKQTQVSTSVDCSKETALRTTRRRNSHNKRDKISIVDANKTSDSALSSSTGSATGPSSYIQYTISYNGILIKRRYREFECLRNAFVSLFPLIMIPPIPKKQTFGDFLSSVKLTSGTLYMNSATVPGASPNNANRDHHLNNLSESSSSDQSTPGKNSAHNVEEDCCNSNNGNNNNSTHATHLLTSSDSMIDHRRRMLSNFLNKCLDIPELRDCDIFKKFLNPKFNNWQYEVTNSPPLLLVPKNPLQCDPLHPEKSTELHCELPIPVTSAKSAVMNLNAKHLLVNLEGSLDHSYLIQEDAESNDDRVGSDGVKTRRRSSASSPEEDEDEDLKEQANEKELLSRLVRIDKKCNKYLGELLNMAAEFGILYNSYSLAKDIDTSQANYLEKISMIYDQDYLTLRQLHQNLFLTYSEPLIELLKLSDIAKKLVKFKYKKYLQMKLISDELVRKQIKLKNLTGESRVDSSMDDHMASSISKLNTTLSKFDEQNNGGGQNEIFYKKKESSYFKIPGVSKLTLVFKEKIYDSDPVKTYDDKVRKLKYDIQRLEKMKVLTGHDFVIIETEVSKQIEKYEQNFRKVQFKKILLNFVRCILEYSRKSLEVWQDFRTLEQ